MSGINGFPVALQGASHFVPTADAPPADVAAWAREHRAFVEQIRQLLTDAYAKIPNNAEIRLGCPPAQEADVRRALVFFGVGRRVTIVAKMLTLTTMTGQRYEPGRTPWEKDEAERRRKAKPTRYGHL